MKNEAKGIESDERRRNGTGKGWESKGMKNEEMGIERDED
jgi:hypothetical protein